MSTFTVGREAEARAAAYLQSHGYAIREQNYRNRWCEIDIVAEQTGTIYFVEVKYRQNDAQGSGLEYITQRKLHQMMRAAEMWLQDHRSNAPYCLAGIELTGTDYHVETFIESLT